MSLPSPNAGPTGVAFGPETADALGTLHRPFRFFATDGLVLAGRDYRPGPEAPDGGASPRRPVVCLPGLTRNSRDFEPLAARLVGPGSLRRVVTFEFRGRGASQYDPDTSHYTPVQELADTLVGLKALGIDEITAFGTSRGGIVTMLAGLVAPGVVRAAILNDIGAEVEIAGLLRIKNYIGRPLPVGLSWDNLVAAMKFTNRAEFPQLDTAGFHRYARRLHREVDGRPALDYDPRLAQTLATVTAETPMPDLWAAFDTLAAVPVLVVRGTLSDILAAETVEKMKARHPGLEAIEVVDEGHAPLIEDAPTLDAVVAFLDRAGA